MRDVRGCLVGLAMAAGCLVLAPGAEARSVAMHNALRAAEAPRAELEASSVRTLPGGTVVSRFTQEVGGMPVVGAGAVVIDPPAGEPTLLFDETTPGIDSPADSVVARSTAIARARRDAAVSRLGAPPTARLVIARGSGATAWEVLLPSAEPLADFLVTVDAETGAVLERHDLLRHETAQAKLFVPNAVVEHDGYSGLADHGDADSPLLTGLRTPVTLEDLKEGQSCLRGDWVTVRKSATEKRVCRDSLDWRPVTRHSNNFEALMAYHHIDQAQRYIQSLGLLPINAEPQNVIVDPIPDDNSFYSPGRDEIQMGRGGVDDAEDADVLVHEYGHAVQDAQNPDAYRGFGADVGAQGEGFGDYLAAAYSTEVAGYDAEWTPCIMEWDATSYDADTPSSPGVCLRRADNPNTLKQQEDECGGREIHCIGEVWASALLDLRIALGDHAGDSVMDRLVLVSHELTPPDPSFNQASRAILEADDSEYPTGMPGDLTGAHCDTLRAELVARELLNAAITCA